jgi:hypothetical protein
LSVALGLTALSKKTKPRGEKPRGFSFMLLLIAQIKPDDFLFMNLTAGFIFGWHLFSPLDV